MTCKCRICGAKLQTETAYKVSVKNKNKYYCSQDEYEQHMQEKEHAEQLIKDIKTVLCEILSMPAIINSYIYKEWKDWNQVATNDVILRYLQEHQNKLHNRISSQPASEFARIKYLSTVLKNSLQDYQVSPTQRPKRQIKDTIIEEYIAKYLDPNLSFKIDMTVDEKVQAIINPLFIDDYLIADAVRSLTYDEFLDTPYWDAITNYKKQQMGYKCERCGNSKHICTHHKTYANHGYEHLSTVINEDLEVLCDACHKSEHHINTTK